MGTVRITNCTSIYSAMKKLSRREFSKKTLAASIAFPMGLSVSGKADSGRGARQPIPLGGPVGRKHYDSPESWISVLRQMKYTAAQCPVDESADDSTLKAYETAAAEANIVIAEVGAWSNPISPDEEARRAAFEKCVRKLALADRIGAKCCVNVSGSRGTKSNGGAHPLNITQETFDMIVEVVRKIIDEVKPTRTFFTLEMLPWSYPDSTESYLRLIHAIDRKAFAAHIDPVNLVNSPARYYGNAELIKEAFRELGKYVKSCHAKDVLLLPGFPINLGEVPCGQGHLDYAVYLEELSKLPNVPLMMEHMKPDEYPVAAKHIRKVGKENGIEI